MDVDTVSALPALVEKVAPVIEASGAERAQLELLQARAGIDAIAGCLDSAVVHLTAARTLAQRLGRHHLATTLGRRRISYLLQGSAPTSDVRGEIERLSAPELDRLTPYPETLLAAWSGDFDRARRLFGQWSRWLLDHGNTLRAAKLEGDGTLIELLAGDAAAAERHARSGIEALEAHGETAFRSSVLTYHAEALLLFGRLDEAERRVEEARAIGSESDVAFAMQWRRASARLRSAEGTHGVAGSLSREALAIALETQMTLEQAEAYGCLAEVLARSGKTDESRNARNRALDLCRRKDAPAYAAYVNRRCDDAAG